MNTLTEVKPVIKNFFISVSTFISVIAFCIIACNSPSRPQPDTGTVVKPETPAVYKADLVVTNVEITPAVVRVGTPSPFNVYVVNNGNIASSDFDVLINARHAGNPNEYIGCCQPTHMRGVEPGETLLVYSGKVGVNDPGSYELVVILKLADGSQIQKFWPFGGTAN